MRSAMPREPGNPEFGTKPARQKTGRTSYLFANGFFLSTLVQIYFKNYQLSAVAF
jgi:hypothetical protein